VTDFSVFQGKDWVQGFFFFSTSQIYTRKKMKFQFPQIFGFEKKH